MPSAIGNAAPAAPAAATPASQEVKADTAAAKEAGESDAESGEELPSLVEGETGEEDEEVLFQGECKLVKLVNEVAPAAATTKDGGGGATPTTSAAGEPGAKGTEEGKTWRWQERGCGIVHINRHKRTGAGRLVMRLRGVGKLLLNTPVFPTGKYERVAQKSVRFLGVDVDAAVPASEAPKASLCSYRATLQNPEKQGEFLAVLRDRFKVTSVA